MARQPILLGTVPNGDGGDTLRQSNTKINQMTEELYATDAAQATSIQGLQDAESSASGRLDVLEQGATGTGQAIEGLQDNLEIAQTAIGELESSREFTLAAGDNITIDRTDPLAPVISSTGGGGPGGVAWGGITGTLADQTDLAQALAGKVAVEAGKGLSTNDYTTPEKTKLASIAEGAQVNVGTNLTQGTRTDTTVGITSSTGTGATLDPASATQAGVMTAADKVKLNGVAASTDQLPEGTTNQYFTAARVRQTLLTGLAAGTNAAIAATDTLLGALAKLQAQLSALGSASARNAVGAGDVYARGGILGTVSSDGSGVPTGAVIERGSNANGEFVKFADGTMICTFESTSVQSTTSAWGSLFLSTVSTFTFPQTFTSKPRVSICSPYTGVASVAWGVIQQLSTSSVSLYGVSAVSSGTVYPAYIAIGRWR